MARRISRGKITSRLKKGPRRINNTKKKSSKRNKLEKFFNPESVAIVGASREPKKVGHVIFRNFLESGFKGRVYPVNPSAQTILGHKVYSSLTKISDSIDLVVIAVPNVFVPKVLDECGKKGIHSVIIVSSGFREIGRHDLEKQIIAAFKKYKIRAMGPNGLGVFDPYSGVDTMFNPRFKLQRPEKGGITFVSQSGAVGAVICDWMAMKGFKLSKFISYGNATDIDEADLMEYLVNDKNTKVICYYIEGVKDGRRFFEFAKKYAKKKPIIVMKGGITEAGTKAVSSHTGSLAGSGTVYKTVFKQTGIIQAHGLEQMFDFARLLVTQPRPKGNNVQIITNGGGFGVMTSDELILSGMNLPKLDKKIESRLKKQYPDFFAIGNPIDLTGSVAAHHYGIALDESLKDKNVDIIVLIVLFQTPMLTADVVDVFIEAQKKSKKPLLVIATGGRYTEVLKKNLDEAGIPTFSYPEDAVPAVKVLYEYYNK